MRWGLVMNKERQLLKRVRDTLRELKETHYDLYWDVQTALDQPEQEQEPVAWMYDHFIKTGHEKQVIFDLVETCARNLESDNCINIRPLYTLPPKREPLSDGEICEILLKKEWKGFVELVRQIEREHGIGVE